jgi:hypothetical protein
MGFAVKIQMINLTMYKYANMNSFAKFSLLVCTLFFFTACTRLEREQEHENQLHMAKAEKDSVEDQLVRTMDEINKNLDMIREKQGLILAPGSNEVVSKKAEVLKNISLINSLIEENKKKIEELTRQSEKLSTENGALAKIAKQTSERIRKQENEILNLKQLLAMEEFKVADLNNKMDEMQVASEVLTSEKNALSESNLHLEKDLNKAFFTYGTYEELKTKNIIEKKGGILGIGKKNILANAFFKNRAYFTELDVRDTKDIPIRGQKPKILTFHPEDSYEWKTTSNEYSSLHIKSPEDFWSTSRFLVVEVR